MSSGYGAYSGSRVGAAPRSPVVSQWVTMALGKSLTTTDVGVPNLAGALQGASVDWGPARIAETARHAATPALGMRENPTGTTSEVER